MLLDNFPFTLACRPHRRSSIDFIYLDWSCDLHILIFRTFFGDELVCYQTAILAEMSQFISFLFIGSESGLSFPEIFFEWSRFQPSRNQVLRSNPLNLLFPDSVLHPRLFCFWSFLSSSSSKAHFFLNLFWKNVSSPRPIIKALIKALVYTPLVFEPVHMRCCFTRDS